MANWSNLKSTISDVIKTNGNQEITGALLQSTLTNIVNAVGENATFAGIATPSTNPGTPDGPIFYVANAAGTYSNFDGITLASPGLVFLYNNSGAWRSLKIYECLQTLGSDITRPVSQDAITKFLSGLHEDSNAEAYPIIRLDDFGVNTDHSIEQVRTKINTFLKLVAFDNTAASRKYNGRCKGSIMGRNIEMYNFVISYAIKLGVHVIYGPISIDSDRQIVLSNNYHIIWKLNTDDGWNVLGSIVNDTGTSITEAMSQKAVTDKLNTKVDNTQIAQSTGTSTTNLMSQKAITDKLNTKVDSTQIVQSTGTSTTSLMSQKAVTDKLNTKVDNTQIAQGTGTSTTSLMSQKAVTDKLNTKVDNTQIAQGTGASTTSLMSQKAVTDKLNTKVDNTQIVQGTGASTTSLMSQKAVTDKLTEFDTNYKKAILDLDSYISNNTERIQILEDDVALIKQDPRVILAYGIERDKTVSSTTCTRIGNMTFHRTLPVQSLMRGCLLDDDGNVVKYLDPDDWTNEDRSGASGQVMVEIPEFYWQFEEEGNIQRIWLSLYNITGFTKVQKMYVSAYEATVERSTGKLCSVVNEDPDYRGGNNNSSLDGQYNSFLGRPATSISRTSFRSYARKRKSGSTEWNCYTYDVHKTLFWLFVVEYATLNSQAAYNSEPASEGYRQGGLGAGVTTWSGKWSSFNGYYPFVPCGHTDSLGNRTGVVSYTAKNDDDSILKTFDVPRYRGVENPFGHIWKWTDGCNIQVSASQENGGTGLSKAFICHNPANFQDRDYANYSHVGNIDRVGSYIKEVLFGVGGEILPKLAGGGSTTYFCDTHIAKIPTSGEALCGLLFGGHAADNANAGLASAVSARDPSSSNTHIGSRLCFIPAIN